MHQGQIQVNLAFKFHDVLRPIDRRRRYIGALKVGTTHNRLRSEEIIRAAGFTIIMAKDRHRIFEIYTSQEEAACELVPNSSGIRSDVAALEACLFQHLVVSGEAGITHVRYKGAAISTREVIAQIEDEFVQLANKLSGNSRVLIDFTGVEEFGSAGIQALMVLNKKLQHRGSRMVLCCLDANVRESFFPVS